MWFGDSPGHDPVCDLFNGFGSPTFPITEQTVTSALQQNGAHGGTTVIAIGTDLVGHGLPVLAQRRPRTSRSSTTTRPPLVDFCTPAGLPGQADRLAQATNGISTVIVDPNTITATILQTLANVLIAADVGCTPSPSLAPFVQSVTPQSYDNLALPHDPRVAGLRGLHGHVEGSALRHGPSSRTAT